MRNILNILYKRDQSEFDHKYACWANNHNGWSKMKKKNRKIAKKRLKEELRKDITNDIIPKQK